MARRRTKRTKRTRRKSTISKLERSLRKTIERSIRKSLKKLTNRKTKKKKRKTKRKKKLQRGGGANEKNLLIQLFDKTYEIGGDYGVAGIRNNDFTLAPEAIGTRIELIDAMQSVLLEYSLTEVNAPYGLDVYQSDDMMKSFIGDLKKRDIENVLKLIFREGGETGAVQIGQRERKLSDFGARDETYITIVSNMAEELYSYYGSLNQARLPAAKLPPVAEPVEPVEPVVAAAAAGAGAGGEAEVAGALTPIPEEPEGEEEPDPEEEEEPQPAPAEGPIPGTIWERVYSVTGDLYYLNTETNETQWGTPQEVVDAEKAAGKIPGTIWERVDDGSGDLYYFNTETNKTQWEAPQEVVEAEKAAEEEETQGLLAQVRERKAVAKAAAAEEARLAAAAAATKIQATYRGHSDRATVAKAAEEQAARAARVAEEEAAVEPAAAAAEEARLAAAAAATKIQATYRGHSDRATREREADVDGLLGEIFSQLNQEPELPVAAEEAANMEVIDWELTTPTGTMTSRREAAEEARLAAAAATKIQATYRGHKDRATRERGADVDGLLGEIFSEVEQGPELPVASNMCTVLQGQLNKVLKQIKVKDQLIDQLQAQIAGGAGAGTAQLQQSLAEAVLEREQYRLRMQELEDRLIELKKELYCSILTKVRIAKMSDVQPLNTTYPTKNSLPAPRELIAEVIGDAAASVDSLDAVWGTLRRGPSDQVTYGILLFAILGVRHGLLQEKGWNLLSDHDIMEVLRAEDIDENTARGVNQGALATLLRQIIAFIEGGNALVPGSFVGDRRGHGRSPTRHVLGASVGSGESHVVSRPAVVLSPQNESLVRPAELRLRGQGRSPTPLADASPSLSQSEGKQVGTRVVSPPPSAEAPHRDMRTRRGSKLPADPPDAALSSQSERNPRRKLPQSRFQELEEEMRQVGMINDVGRVARPASIGPDISITFDPGLIGFEYLRPGGPDSAEHMPEVSVVKDNGQAAEKGVKVGYLIKSVNGKETKSEGEGDSGLSSEDMDKEVTLNTPTTIVFDVSRVSASGPAGKLSPLGQPESTSAASDRGAGASEEIGQIRANSPDLKAAQESVDKRKAKAKVKADAAEAAAHQAAADGAVDADELMAEAKRLREVANKPVRDVKEPYSPLMPQRGGGMSRKHLKRKKTKRKKTKRKKTKGK